MLRPEHVKAIIWIKINQCFVRMNKCSLISNKHNGGCLHTVAYPGIFFGGGVQQIQLRAEDREEGDLGAVAP